MPLVLSGARVGTGLCRGAVNRGGGPRTRSCRVARTVHRARGPTRPRRHRALSVSPKVFRANRTIRRHRLPIPGYRPVRDPDWAPLGGPREGMPLVLGFCALRGGQARDTRSAPRPGSPPHPLGVRPRRCRPGRRLGVGPPRGDHLSPMVFLATRTFDAIGLSTFLASCR